MDDLLDDLDAKAAKGVGASPAVTRMLVELVRAGHRLVAAGWNLPALRDGLTRLRAELEKETPP